MYFIFWSVCSAYHYRQHYTHCKALVFKLLKGRFWGFFCPARATPCTDGGEILHEGVDQRPNFTPIGATITVYSPKTRNFTEILPNFRIFMPTGHILHRGIFTLRDFYKICRVCMSFQNASVVKICIYLLKGLWSYGMGFPKFSVPQAHSSETMRRTPKIFGGARMCSSSSITMPSLTGLGFCLPLGGKKYWVFSFVCLFVCA